MSMMFEGVWKYKWKVIGIFITVVVGVISNLALPMYLSEVINTAIPNMDTLGILSIGGTMLIFVVLGFISTIGTGFLSSYVSSQMGKDIRSNLFSKIQYFSQTEFDQFSTSSLITRTNNDVIQVQTFMNMFLRICLMAPIMSIGGIVLAFAKSTSMSLILLVSMPIMVVFVVVIAKVATPLSNKMQSTLDQINLIARETLTGLRVARAFGTEDYEEKRFDNVNKSFMNNSIRLHMAIGIMVPGLSLVLYGTMVALLAFGGYQVIQKNMAIPVGDVIAVIQYVMQIMMSVMMLSMVFIMYPRAAISAKRIQEVFDTQPTIENSDQPIMDSEKRGYVTFKDVSFAYPNATSNAIEHISFSCGPGEVSAIIGSTGCGKSTLINLIPRFYDVSEGSIEVDGIDIKDMDIEVLRKKIGYVPQKAFLFKGSIAHNVGYGGVENDEQIENAIRIAQSYDFVMEKEHDFQFPIAQGATNVSGGQRQRLAIARAIARKPEIYIFDDSFSALDFKTDAALRKALLAETKDATLIIVAQRVSTIKDATRILVLEDGKCVGIGTHDELLQNCNVYQEIVYSQLSKEEV